MKTKSSADLKDRAIRAVAQNPPLQRRNDPPKELVNRSRSIFSELFRNLGLDVEPTDLW